MLSFHEEEWKLIISNIISLINLILLCYSYTLIKKKDFLRALNVSMALVLLVYAVSGLWISVISNIAVIVRNAYNARSEKPKIAVNFLIVAVACVLCLPGFSKPSDLIDLADFLPLASLIFYSAFVIFSKNGRTLMKANCADSCIWVIYDLQNLLLFNVITDVFNILVLITTVSLDAISRKQRPETDRQAQDT